jgi:hypothetical protein
MKLVRQVCAECGSGDVLADAYAEWDIENQSWTVQNVMDNGHHCNACDGECSIEEVDIDLDEDRLDELVHDMKAAEAADINNRTIEARAMWLLGQGFTIDDLVVQPAEKPTEEPSVSQYLACPSCGSIDVRFAEPALVTRGQPRFADSSDDCPIYVSLEPTFKHVLGMVNGLDERWICMECRKEWRLPWSQRNRIEFTD